MLGMIWNYEFFSKEAFLQSKNKHRFAEVCFDLTEKFLNSQNSVGSHNFCKKFVEATFFFLHEFSRVDLTRYFSLSLFAIMKW